MPPVKDYSRGSPPKDVCRGRRSKICVTDWNEDGLLDLLVGDYAVQKPDLPEPTPEQKAEHAEIRKELEKIQEQYRALSEKLYGKDRVHIKEQIEEIEKEQQWVWLFLRKKI